MSKRIQEAASLKNDKHHSSSSSSSSSNGDGGEDDRRPNTTSNGADGAPLTAKQSRVFTTEDWTRMETKMKEMETKMEAMEQRRSQIKKEMEAKIEATVKAEIEKVNLRLQKIFYPSVLFCLLETAVTKCLVKFGYKEDVDKKLIYSCTQFAHAILGKLLDKNSANPDPNSVKQMTAVSGLTLSQTATRLTKIIHNGIIIFIDTLSVHHFQNWPPNRNPLMHNGLFLDAFLYGRLKPNTEVRHVSETLEDEINNDMLYLVNQLTVPNASGGCKNSLGRVKAAINKKERLQACMGLEWSLFAVYQSEK